MTTTFSANVTKAQITVRPHRNEVAQQMAATTAQRSCLPTGWKIWRNGHYVGRIDSMHISYPQWGIDQRGYIHSQNGYVWEVGEFWECVYDLCETHRDIEEYTVWDEWYAGSSSEMDREDIAEGTVVC